MLLTMALALCVLIWAALIFHAFRTDMDLSFLIVLVVVMLVVCGAFKFWVSTQAARTAFVVVTGLIALIVFADGVSANDGDETH